MKEFNLFEKTKIRTSLKRLGLSENGIDAVVELFEYGYELDKLGVSLNELAMFLSF